MSLTAFPEQTDGPNRISGPPVCLDIHAGITENKHDSCCACCNPCLHATSPGFAAGCCKCAPAMLCCTFTLDESQTQCCKSFSTFALAEFAGESNPSYVFDFGDFTVTLQIESTNLDYLDSSCQWRLSSPILAYDETYQIDHTVGDCFNLPDFSMANVDVAGCVGSLSFTVYENEKLPFQNAHPTDVTEIAIPSSPCNCTAAADRLCVGGVRHLGDDPEYVIFEWNSDLGDRWEYCPPGLTDAECNTDLLREIIYLRGDDDGNCWLELDFEQTGPYTNDWAVPPNSFDEAYPNEVRDGMLPVDFCGCGLFAKSTAEDGRYVRIHAGDCARYKYRCGTCRCIPPTLCVIGGTESVSFRGEAVWDGTAWNMEVDYLTFQFTLVEGEDGECAMHVESNYELPFEDSLAINCGNFLQSENSTAFDQYNATKHAFVWTSGSACGCGSTPRCGPCPDRCGGPPETLYLSVIYGIRDNEPYDPIDLGAFECQYDITMQFWDRSGLVPQCGYIGEAFHTCQGVTYRMVASMSSPGFLITVSKYSTVDGSLVSSQVFPYDLSNPTYCEPFEFSASHNPTGNGAYYFFSVLE